MSAPTGSGTGLQPVASSDSGTGLQPVCSPGILPGSPACTFHPFASSKAVRITRRNLPHWRQDGGTYFVTFRLADSVPQQVLQHWNQERDAWLQHHPQPWDGKTIAEYRARFQDAREEWLDQGHGSCTLRDPRAAQIVADALCHFDGARCVMDTFVVMPNHVHAIVKPLPGNDLSDLLHSWKGFTAREINKMLERQGDFWMDEGYDHLVRDWAELERLREYISQNPVKARLRNGEFVLAEMRALMCEAGQSPGRMPGLHTGSKPVPPSGAAPPACVSPVLPARAHCVGTEPGDPPQTAGLRTGSKPMPLPHFELCEIKDHDGWRKLPGKIVYHGPYVQVEECSFITPARPDAATPWTVAHRKSAVAVAPVTRDGKFILIHQERLPLRRTLWEFPAGQIDDEHSCETIAATALRELDEEAGCELTPDGELIPLGWFFGSQGFTAEHVYLFVARPVRIARPPKPVGGEHIGKVRAVSPEELRKMIAENLLQDALTLALFARMSAKGIV